MKGLALATVGLWVILQTTYGPLATKIGLITGGSSSPSSSGGSSSTTPPVEKVPPTGQPFQTPTGPGV